MNDFDDGDEEEEQISNAKVKVKYLALNKRMSRDEVFAMILSMAQDKKGLGIAYINLKNAIMKVDSLQRGKTKQGDNIMREPYASSSFGLWGGGA